MGILSKKKSHLFGALLVAKRALDGGEGAASGLGDRRSRRRRRPLRLGGGGRGAEGRGQEAARESKSHG